MIKFAAVDAGIEWLTVEQVARLVDVTRHARDRFLVLLLWSTGIRIGEALGLRREDMHLLADSQALGCQVRGPHVHVRRADHTLSTAAPGPEAGRLALGLRDAWGGLEVRRRTRGACLT
ncbi:tyrosine-type recombinase/integrase [Couchioplanes caeruleus]|uniref:tyrosine-type recombinase/integrase n=1 Tax=Couchioplanes caeruleus TaxID=56438 RepID=UPI0008FF5FFE